MEPFERMRVGDVVVTALLDGVRDLDGTIMDSFHGVPAEELIAFKDRHPGVYGENDAWRLHVRAWTLQHSDGTVLVDTGIGEALSPAWFGDTGLLLEALAAAAIDHDSIRTVVISHVHDDHVGGTVDAELRPRFPQARHLIQHADLEWERDAAASVGGDDGVFDTLLAPLEAAGLLDVLDGDHDLGPSIRLVHVPGHTPGHQVVDVRSAGERLVISADSFNHPIQLGHPEWPSGADADHELAADSRRRMLRELDENPRTLIAPTHFADAFGTLTKGPGDRMTWAPLGS